MAVFVDHASMSNPLNHNRPAFPDRRQQEGRRGGQRRPAPPLPDGPRVCRVCGVAQALPDDETCGPCGDRAIERARAGVDAWIGMDAERVRELERQELERNQES